MEKTSESTLDSKEIKPVNPKGNQTWMFTGRSNAEAETLILWPLDAKSWFTGKEPDSGKDWGPGGEGSGREQNCWMASLTQQTWVWANSRRWWGTGKHSVLQAVGQQRVGHNWATEQQHGCKGEWRLKAPGKRRTGKPSFGRSGSSLLCVGFSLWWHLLFRGMSSTLGGSGVVAHGLSCSAACGIFPDQGFNPFPLRWQVDSLLLEHQGNPIATDWSWKPLGIEAHHWLHASSQFTQSPWSLFLAYLLKVLALKSFRKAMVPCPLALKDTVQTGQGISKACWRRSSLDSSGTSPTTK